MNKVIGYLYTIVFLMTIVLFFHSCGKEMNNIYTPPKYTAIYGICLVLLFFLGMCYRDLQGQKYAAIKAVTQVLALVGVILLAVSFPLFFYGCLWGAFGTIVSLIGTLIGFFLFFKLTWSSSATGTYGIGYPWRSPDRDFGTPVDPPSNCG